MNGSKIALIAVMLALLLTRSVPAQFDIPDQVATICSATSSSSTPLLLGNATGQSQLIMISAILMLTMLLISSAAYMLGRAFDINMLLKFSKDEMREIAITSLVVIVFLGAFSAVSGGVGLGGFITQKSGTPASSVFSADCTTLATSSLNMVNTWMIISVYQDLYAVLVPFWIGLQPGDFGPGFSPMAGLGVLTDSTDGVLTNFAMFTGIFAVFQMGIAVLLGVIYVLFPVFFYAGIVLRTIPFTRAAGGSFLGLFIAFYFVFSFLIYFFMSPYSQPVQQTATAPTIGSISIDTTNPFDLSGITNPITSSSIALLPWFINEVVEPFMFTMLGIVFSLMISLDFMESLGDMLGSPALSQRGAMRGLI